MIFSPFKEIGDQKSDFEGFLIEGAFINTTRFCDQGRRPFSRFWWSLMISASLFKIKVTFFTRESTFVKDQGAFEGREPTPKINISGDF